MSSEFTLSAYFDVAPAKLYEAWLDSAEHSKMIGSSAKASNQVNDQFEAWDGYISGRNLELEPGKRIVQSWRTVEFSGDEMDSHIELTFEAQGNGTKLTLRHWDLPEHGAQYESGWEESYFVPMRTYFNA